MTQPGTDRRTLLMWLGTGALWPRELAAQAYSPKFLSDAGFQLVETLSELIVPADDHSPGARQAGVARYIDFVLANSPDSARAAWSEESAGFEAFAQQHAGSSFLQAKPATQAEILRQLAAAAAHPATPAQKFFAHMRDMTVFAYYTSETGLVKELEYKGNQVLGAFPGCEHG